jgi:hypothetical protein
MPRQIIDTGSVENDPAAETIRSAFTKLNDMTSELYSGVTATGVPAINVKASPYSAVGNDSTDDTTAIQSALNAAYLAGGGIVVFPPAIYKITQTLERPVGVSLMGLRRAGTGQGARLSWRGAAGGVMMRTDTAGSSSPTNPGGGASIAGSVTQDLYFHGNDIAATCVQFASGNIDMSSFHRCWFARVTGHCMEFNTGITNGRISECRWDTHGGFAIYWNGTGMCILTIDGGCTWDGAVAGTTEATGGFLWLNDATGTAANRAHVRIRDFHPEVNGGLKTYATGAASEPEKRGLIRLTPNTSTYGQFVLSLEAWVINVAATTVPFSVVYMTSAAGTLLQHEASAKLNFRQIEGLTRWNGVAYWNKLIGNVPTAAMWPHEGTESSNLVRQVQSFMWTPGTTAPTVADQRAAWGYYNTAGRTTYS